MQLVRIHNKNPAIEDSHDKEAKWSKNMTKHRRYERGAWLATNTSFGGQLHPLRSVKFAVSKLYKFKRVPEKHIPGPPKKQYFCLYRNVNC